MKEKKQKSKQHISIRVKTPKAINIKILKRKSKNARLNRKTMHC